MVIKTDDQKVHVYWPDALSKKVPASELPSPLKSKAEIKGLDFWYGQNHVLRSINLKIPEFRVSALIGPSGCGKTTLLRCFNRMHDLYPDNRYRGEIELLPDSVNLLAPEIDPIEVRMKIAMVFQKPNPFPKSIFDNVAYGLSLRGIKNKRQVAEKVELSLKQSALWNEVKDRLHKSGLSLSGGQQQRLCLARALATDPSIILMDEPTSALDPISTGRIEELIMELKTKVTVLIVTHNMQQALRISDQTSFFLNGELVESSPTRELFTSPKDQRTKDYVEGRFG